MSLYSIVPRRYEDTETVGQLLGYAVRPDADFTMRATYNWCSDKQCYQICLENKTVDEAILNNIIHDAVIAGLIDETNIIVEEL